MDAGSHFQKKDIAVVFASSTSHKSVNMIEKLNNILQQALKKMCELREEWEDVLF